MAVTYATRGDFAEALYDLIGFDSPTSNDGFDDAGGAASTLKDLGITNGIGNNQYGSSRQITRGEAFTMIARALGMADANTSIEYASQMLVEAGIIQGYGGDPNQLGLNDPIQTEHLALLLNPETGRVAPLMEDINNRETGETLRESILVEADDVRNTNIAENDPAFAAFLATQGVRKADVKANIELLMGTGGDTEQPGGLWGQELADTRLEFEDMLEQAMTNVTNDFQDRGLFRSGVRQQAETEAMDDNARQLGSSINAIDANYLQQVKAEQDELRYLDQEVLQRATQAESDYTQKQIEDAYDYTFGI